MHILCTIIPLLVVAINARPSPNETSQQWRPVETQPLRINPPERAHKMAPNPSIKDSIKLMTNQLNNHSNTSTDFTMDTRTPPRVKLQHKQQQLDKKRLEAIENSHPGVAIPVDVDSIMELTTQKRAVIYRENKPTTDSGISTWILLSGQSTTSKPTKKVANTTEKPTRKTTVAPISVSTEKLVKTIKTTEKPLKTTPKPKVTTRKPKPTPIPTTTVVTTTKILSKIKASVLSNAVNNKTKTTPVLTTTPPSISAITASLATKIEDLATVTISESNILAPEAKDGSVELSTTTKRPKRPTNNKRKKNKTRKRKPAIDRMANGTKIATKEKPFGTQIYNYLSREVMPTVGVGLVGLMVTAGLASYFFNPFGGLRRAYDSAVDRKDYFYHDDYSAGGVAEEELIGKVIAGMPEQSDYSYRTPLARKDYRHEPNYNNYDTYLPQKDYQTVSVGSNIGYGRDVIEQQKESGYTVDDTLEKQQFVVGSVPKEFESQTPAVVPEHGPRSLRVKRVAQNDEDNEIIDYKSHNKHIQNHPELIKINYKSESTTVIPQTTVYPLEQPNFFNFVRNLLELKVRMGLDFLLKTTDTVSTYLRGVQQRMNTILREEKSRKR